MSIERVENVIEHRTVELQTPSGLRAELLEDGTRVVFTCSTIDGQSAIRLSSAMLADFETLVKAVRDDSAIVIPHEPEPEPDVAVDPEP